MAREIPSEGDSFEPPSADHPHHRDVCRGGLGNGLQYPLQGSCGAETRVRKVKYRGPKFKESFTLKVQIWH